MGWMLFDKQPSVRHAAMHSLENLLSDADTVSSLSLFTTRFKSRILEMTRDVSSEVSVATLRVTRLLLTAPHSEATFDNEESQVPVQLVFDKNLDIRRAAATYTATFLEKFVEDMSELIKPKETLLEIITLIEGILELPQFPAIEIMIDALWDVVPALKEYEVLVKILEEESSDDQAERREITVRVLRAVASLIALEGEPRDPTTQLANTALPKGRTKAARQASELASELRVDFSKFFLAKLPHLLNAHLTETPVLADLIVLVSYIRPEDFSQERQQKSLKTILGHMKKIFLKPLRPEDEHTESLNERCLIRQDYMDLDLPESESAVPKNIASTIAYLAELDEEHSAKKEAEKVITEIQEILMQKISQALKNDNDGEADTALCLNMQRIVDLAKYVNVTHMPQLVKCILDILDDFRVASRNWSDELCAICLEALDLCTTWSLKDFQSKKIKAEEMDLVLQQANETISCIVQLAEDRPEFAAIRHEAAVHLTNLHLVCSTGDDERPHVEVTVTTRDALVQAFHTAMNTKPTSRNAKDVAAEHARSFEMVKMARHFAEHGTQSEQNVFAAALLTTLSEHREVDKIARESIKAIRHRRSKDFWKIELQALKSVFNEYLKWSREAYARQLEQLGKEIAKFYAFSSNAMQLEELIRACIQFVKSEVAGAESQDHGSRLLFLEKAAVPLVSKLGNRQAVELLTWFVQEFDALADSGIEREEEEWTSYTRFRHALEVVAGVSEKEKVKRTPLASDKGRGRRPAKKRSYDEESLEEISEGESEHENVSRMAMGGRQKPATSAAGRKAALTSPSGGKPPVPPSSRGRKAPVATPSFSQVSTGTPGSEVAYRGSIRRVAAASPAQTPPKSSAAASRTRRRLEQDIDEASDQGERSDSGDEGAEMPAPAAATTAVSRLKRKRGAAVASSSSDVTPITSGTSSPAKGKGTTRGAGRKFVVAPAPHEEPEDEISGEENGSPGLSPSPAASPAKAGKKTGAVGSAAQGTRRSGRGASQESAPVEVFEESDEEDDTQPQFKGIGKFKRARR
eukprot:TRINITY_DN15309_c0_g1::TRINITY_DN15309_c0_g1_i1::g.30759::m.30759 TRINITY_DN15309_c0_g1::TRINITY_DN15309_c0_g1_i1::g.30759  ORF type:complete len:1045 (-),score=260.07,sp/O82265/SCC3_ARATH/23.48/1e-21,HEAT/PF02985.17/5.9,HEAT/PF02985.17/1.7e+02,HEAT/PF02985.17/4.9e+03,HEAT/PF02985.17/1.5e+04,PEPCK_ATP/PF01293.15/0.62,PEPCK_ATP/PF01293.15/1.1e+02,HEAT_2/PF13646.1/10,HEAT_2/PF13646.1/5.9e+02,HEAT_2/PF13646.1/3.7e+03,HEAT_2/PF13646.1/3.9e+02,HEAT_2/PF13646.1/5.9e+02,HEAT_2/PF13646.1/8.1e+03 TRINITY